MSNPTDTLTAAAEALEQARAKYGTESSRIARPGGGKYAEMKLALCYSDGAYEGLSEALGILAQVRAEISRLSSHGGEGEDAELIAEARSLIGSNPNNWRVIDRIVDRLADALSRTPATPDSVIAELAPYLKWTDATATSGGAVTPLAKAAAELLRWAEIQSCQHEDTHRGGVIWTICGDCGAKWADDQGGFPGYREPPEFAAMRAALRLTPSPQPADGEG